ncbi:energy transducer TonB family protein [Candidatus Entotheonella palauensis]|uniref:energy transducer TonB family protein n=1 Tax=Candidatus Entotheonella palauensis TaxID=93172 RepID=UPI000B7F6187|nr:energy transducer TonB [Candidatus Entotheonella palauensis]
MTKSRLWRYMLVSIVLHLFLLWLLRWLPPYQAAELAAPVPIRLLQAPAATPKTPPAQAERRAVPKPPAPPSARRGGVLADLPKPPVQERPDDARIVSRFDSRAQDIGPGETGTRRSSGQNPPPRVPELALPERYDGAKQKPTRVQPQAKLQRAQPKPKPDQAVPKPSKTPESKLGLRPAFKPKARRYRITPEQEVAMLQREQSAPNDRQRHRPSLDEHFDRLSRAQPLPTFDAPGVYEHGPEQPGEGSSNNGGGKFRSVDAYGLKYFSYLIGVEQQIELVFSIPFFEPRNRRLSVPIVGFTIQRNGNLSEAVLLRSSGYPEIDQALLEAVRRAAPYGPFPDHLPDPSISIRVFLTS